MMAFSWFMAVLAVANDIQGRETKALVFLCIAVAFFIGDKIVSAIKEAR